MRSLSTSLLFLVLLVSCASQQDFNMPVHRLETPEVAGRTWGGGLDIGFTGSQKVRLNEVYPYLFDSSVTEINKDKAMSENGALAFNLRVGFGSAFEAVFRDRGDSPAMYGLKWQFSGKNRSAKGYGWKLATALLGGATTLKDDETITINNSSYSNKSETDVKSGEWNFLAGYRASPSVLFYGTTHTAWYDVNGKLTVTGEPTVRTTGWSWQYGQTVGVELSHNAGVLKLETGLVRGSFRDKVSRTDSTFGGSLGFQW